MTFRSLEEIFAVKDDALNRLHQRVGNLTTAQGEIQRRDDGWSIKEIVEHLAIVEEQLLELITALLVKTERASPHNSGVSPFEISLEPHFQRSQAEKYITRDRYAPSGMVVISESLRRLDHVHTQLRALHPRLQSVDLGLLRFPHWVFGPLTLGQWIAFIGAHEERHLAQIESILASPDFLGNGDDRPGET